MKKILITGENSYIGTSFKAYMKQYADEYQIETISVRGNEWKNKSFSEYDSVFHVAGIAHSDSGKISKEKENLYRKVNTDLTVEVAKKAKEDGVKQFIFMSSAIVYGGAAPIGRSKVITRDTPVSPFNCYGDSKVQAERRLHEIEDSCFKVVILRPPMIYGKGCKGNYRLLVKIANTLPIFPYVDNRRSMLYVENLCEFVRLMIANEEQGIFWPQNREYTNTSKMIQMIAKAHGKKMYLTKIFNWGLMVLRLFTGVVDKAMGNFVYEEAISTYEKQCYQLLSLEESIRKIEEE